MINRISFHLFKNTSINIIAFIVSIIFISANAQAVRNITINQGHIEPMPIAINFFESNSELADKTARDITLVISNDLGGCQYFKIIPTGAFIENKLGINHTPLFASWRQIGAQFLLNGKIKQIGDKIEISFILWDTSVEKAIHKEILELPAKIWRRSAHKIADRIYQRVTGDKGYFDTRIAYITETGSPLKKVKRLTIMDFDGKNQRYLTDGRNLVLTPRFSPKADKILYMSYVNRVPRVHLYDLRTNKDSLLGAFPGMSFSPKFSPDGTKVLMSVAKLGATNILEIDLRTKTVKKLTNNGAINTSPSYSPDGRKIVFNSDRSGTRQIYVMDTNGSNVERISFGAGVYATPVWSPRGDYIAFTKIRGGFSIAVMKPDGSDERTIAKGYLVEGPTWSPSGSLVMFTKEKKGNSKIGNPSRIIYVDLTGNNLNYLPTKTNASDPEWSNLLD
jgi:TolB protein